MNKRVFDELMKELRARGFSPAGASPNDTMVIDPSSTEIADLLDLMVVRREKIFHSVEVVGKENAQRSYEDVLKVIDAIKAVVGRLEPS